MELVPCLKLGGWAMTDTIEHKLIEGRDEATKILSPSAAT